MHRFLYHKTIIKNTELELSEAESHHLSRVLRLKEEDEILLINGKGESAPATIRKINKKNVTVLVKEVTCEKNKPRVHVAFGLSKSSAMDFIYHRCTELGVMSLQPLITDHSIRAEKWNADRWNRVVEEVAKQCQTAYFPLVHEPVKLTSWLENREKENALIICDENKRENTSWINSPKQADVLVGSEGGWSVEESKIFSGLDCHHLGLGKNRLRVETACLVSVALVKQKIGEI